MLVVLWVWSLRLTHNYFRRERWRFGWREDWRFAEMRRRNPRHFWWQSFFVAYLVQQLMLVGLVLPVYAAHLVNAPSGALDALATASCLAGVLVAAFADSQLSRFMAANHQRRARGEPTVPILDTGLWRLSRHPNYFGEQLFWWGLALFGGAVGAWWTLAGTLFNSAIMARVTMMTEARMQRGERAAAWLDYKARTSMWIPWPQRQHR